MTMTPKRFPHQYSVNNCLQSDGNHGAFYFKRLMMEKMGRKYRSPLAIFRTIRTKQDLDRPDGATDMFFSTK